ncbi:MAG: DUF1553 domain-containing protein [Acidobacteria bacterium]|nr:DUF1553 domain-containing protein [Acidobacteriota bacterium]
MKTAALLVLLTAALGAQEYETAVRPLLAKSCLACHSGATPQGGLDLSTAAGALKGGKHGAAYVPGNAEASLMVTRVVGGTMPPAGLPKLDSTAVSALRAWIDRQSAARDTVTEADVLPIFQMRCVTCHGKRVQEAGLDLRTQASRLKGGKSGPALVPGRPEDSLIMQKIGAGKMPPPEKLFEAFVRPPTTPEVEKLRAWIAAGCPPEPAQQTAADEPAILPKDREHWAFTPPRKTTPPASGHVVDAFIRAKLAWKGLPPAPEASRLTLLRRAYFDVIGLPPTPAEAAAFLADTAPGAWERLIDKLLESPHYGERWAQFWLNAAGYSDSEGIIDEDKIRHDAWRYRDSVIRALNADQPYDRFLTEQLAGDELIDYKKIGDVTQREMDTLAATGFLRMTPDGTYSPANGSVAERLNVIADEIEVLSTAVLGLSVNCARCHNHKYDPISQRDYYRLSAVLQTALDPYDWLKPTERHLEIAFASDKAEAVRANEPIEAEIRKLEASPEAKEQKAKTAIAALKKRLVPPPRIRALFDMGGDPSPAYLLRRGDAQNVAARLAPAVPRVLAAGLPQYSPQPPRAGTSGNRLALARWLTHPDHPLTARVIVNRVWMHHFGQGIVQSPANFGRMGIKPTHPELLDWLAREFVESGWSLKKLHRLILTSATYKQSSQLTAAALERDPENQLLARFSARRLDAEQLHDSILRVTGRLSPRQFGPAIAVDTRPGGETTHGSSVDGFRRAIYVMQRRTTPVSQLEVFDQPVMLPNCVERRNSTVPTQALQLSNSPVIAEHAKNWAAQFIVRSTTPGDAVKQIYLTAFTREPTTAESGRAVTALESLESHWQAHLEKKGGTIQPKEAFFHALTSFCHTILSAAEFSYVD